MVKKLLLTILCLSMMITQSFQILAYDEEPYTPIIDEQIVSEDDAIENAEEVQEAVVLNEDESLRDVSSKTFIMSDKSVQKVLYTIPVHYEEDGEWKEIDNTLIEDNNDDINGYANKKSKLKIKFSKKVHENNLGSITINDYSIKWGISDFDNKSNAIITKSEINDNDQRTNVFNKTYQNIMYEDIFDNISLEYAFDSQSIKENIIIKDKTDIHTFTFNYKVNKLKLEMNADGIIEAKDEETDEVVFIMPKPFMVDSNGMMSEEVGYEIIESKNKQYVIQISADKEWINDDKRVYPIVIDPIITFKQDDNSAIQTTYISKWNADSNYYTDTKLLVGMESAEYGFCRTLVKVILPDMNRGDMLVDAQLGMAMYKHSFYATSTPDLQINAHMITEDFSIGDVTWAEQPAFESMIQDYSFIKDSDTTNAANWKYFDITNATKRSYEDGNIECSLMIKSWIEVYQSTQDLINYAANGYFYDNQNTSNQTYHPYVSLTYRNNKGIEPYWDFTTIKSDNGDTIAVNNYSGNVVIEHVDASTNGILPVTISHIYNGYQAEEDVMNIGPKVGKGWKLNIQQTLRSSEHYGLSGETKTTYPYVYMDEDGTEHYFKQTDDGIIDEDGLGLELTENDTTLTIKDKSDNMLIFDKTKGILLEIKDNHENTITITYDAGNNITSVKDQSDHIITFNNSNGYLTSITDHAGRTTTYTYDSNHMLTKITDPYSDDLQLEYLSDGTLHMHSYDKGRLINFDYSSQLTGYRLNALEEYALYGDKGQSIRFDRSLYNTTTITTNGVDCAESDDDITTVFQFDNYGRVKSRYSYTDDKELGAQSIGMTSGEASEDDSNIKSLNRINVATGLSPSVNNLLLNHSGESTSNWYSSSSVGSATFTFTSTTSEYLFGQKSFKLNVTSCATNARARFNQDHDTTHIKPNTTYTASAYIKTQNIKEVSGQSDGGAALLVWINAPSVTTEVDKISEYITGTTDEAVNDGWRRVSVTFTTPSDLDYIRINGVIRGATGTAYFDGLQLEEGDTPSPYNMLENSGFERTSSNFPTSWSGTNLTSSDLSVTANPLYNNKSYVMKAGTTGRKFLNQTVKVSGSESDSYIVSGWAYGKGKRDDGVNYKYRLEILIYYTDGSYIWKGAALFNETVEGWKHASAAFNLDDEDDTKNRTPRTITVYLRSYYSANDIYFDGIQLIKRDVDVYSYDEDGNIKKNGIKEYTYDNDKVLTETDGIDTTYEYTYNDDGDIEKVVHKVGTTEKITETYNYDEDNGNLLNTVVQGGDLQTMTENEYSDSGAFVSETIDEDGNETLYSYNELKGLIEKITDSKGNETNYSYAEDLLSKIETEGLELIISYDEFDRLYQLIGETTNYTFLYDDYGNPESVKIGNTTITTNNYKRYNGDLESTELGNGFTISYTYDEYGNVIEVEENDELSESFKYDKEGVLLYKIDHIKNIKTKYDYDLKGNIIRIDCYDTTAGYFIDAWLYGYEYGYDEYDRLVKRNTKTQDGTVSNTVTYGAGSLVSNYAIDSGKKITYSYDDLNRMTQKSLNTTTPVNIIYEYKDSQREGNYTTGKISEEVIGDTTYEYTYDSLGNITEIIATRNNESKTIKYTYDAYSRLVREDNGLLGKTTTYTYVANNNQADGGNIKSKKEYAYNTDTLSNPIKTIEYEYENSNWKDQLTSYNNQTITYDAIGNPLTYKGYDLTWNGRKLMSMSNETDTITYTYSSDGYKSSKTVNGVTTTYTYLDGQLIKEERPTESLTYTYDNLGNLAKLSYTTGSETTNYYAVCNSRGDVEALYTVNGTMAAKYIYDAWGNTKVVDASGNEITSTIHIGNINPIRYRGYYYDKETNLYYLLSRYYDSEVGRFISSDSVGYIEPEDVNGLNLYAYCLNNPVNYVDPTGHSVILIGLIVGALIGLGTAAYVDYTDDGEIFNGSVAWYDYLGATALGAACGVSLGSAGTALSTFASSSFTLGTGLSVTAGGALAAGIELTVTGAQVLQSVGTLALTGSIMYLSKHRPGMTNRAPFSWTNKNEGIDAMKKFNGDANKAADYIMNNHIDEWRYGAGNDRNVIKKWLDRVIRKFIER